MAEATRYRACGEQAQNKIKTTGKELITPSGKN